MMQRERVLAAARTVISIAEAGRATDELALQWARQVLKGTISGQLGEADPQGNLPKNEAIKGLEVSACSWAEYVMHGGLDESF